MSAAREFRLTDDQHLELVKMRAFDGDRKQRLASARVRWIRGQDLPIDAFLARAAKAVREELTRSEQLHVTRYFHAGATVDVAVRFIRPLGKCECGAGFRRHYDGGVICADRCDLAQFDDTNMRFDGLSEDEHLYDWRQER